jgi:hypothetical protein
MKREQMVLITILALLGLGFLMIKHASDMIEDGSSRRDDLRTSSSSAPGATTGQRRHHQANLQRDVEEVDKSGFWIEKLLDSPRV